MKKFFLTALVAIILLASGVFLAFYTEYANIACYILGGVSILLACLKFFDAYRKNTIKKDVLLCILLLVLGLVLIFLKDELITILPIIIGVCVVVYELVKIIKNFSLSKTNSKAFIMLLVSSLIGVIFAVVNVCLIKTIENNTKLILTGALLIYYGLQYIFSTAVISFKDDTQEIEEDE